MCSSWLSTQLPWSEDKNSPPAYKTYTDRTLKTWPWNLKKKYKVRSTLTMESPAPVCLRIIYVIHVLNTTRWRYQDSYS